VGGPKTNYQNPSDFFFICFRLIQASLTRLPQIKKASPKSEAFDILLWVEDGIAFGDP